MNNVRVSHSLPTSVRGISSRQKIVEFRHLTNVQETLFALRTLGYAYKPLLLLIRERVRNIFKEALVYAPIPYSTATAQIDSCRSIADFSNDCPIFIFHSSVHPLFPFLDFCGTDTESLDHICSEYLSE